MTFGLSRACPKPVLLGLTLAVLLAHLALLRGLSLMPDPPSPPPPQAFITRSVELVPARPPQATPGPDAPPPRRARATATQTARPAPARQTSSLGTPLVPPPAALEQAAGPAPRSGEAPADLEPPPSAPQPPHDQATLPAAYALPGSVRLRYAVEANKFPYQLNAELLWQHNGASYDARLTFGAFGQARVQTSHGQVTPEGLAPLRFSDKYRSEVAAHFNREQGRITFSANTPDAPLGAGAQDRLSLLVQLAALLAGNPDHYPPGSTLSLQTIGPRSADTWLFTVAGNEVLSLPGGAQATRKLVRKPRQEYDQTIELWLAPALGYLPARIRITETNGDFVDQQWQGSAPQE